MFAGDEEQQPDSVSLGIGAVLAILASPGAFASIFLMNKYSTLLQWMRGQSFNAYRVSVGDEYFFVVFSMTITGLVMVLRWNRLFPDRRDFANLAVLPIPIRNVFLANFAALFGLAILFGVDVNAVSSFLFPLVVSMSDSTITGFLRIAMSHSAAVLSASLFSFFSVFALIGVLMLVLPGRLFRPVSICVRMLLVVGLLTEFFSNLFLQLLTGNLPKHPEVYARFLPSFWFLGVYENVAGFAKLPMGQLGRQAVIALAAAVVIAIAAYSLCYRRYFIRLAESLDVVAGVRRRRGFRAPEWLRKLLFRSEFEHACTAFVWKVIWRSERHLMFFGGYLGIGIVMVAQTAIDSANRHTKASLPNSDLLAVPLIIAFFVITGLRFVADVPAMLNANWIFQVSLTYPSPPPDSILRRTMLMAVLPWQVLLLPLVTARSFGWTIALLHSATVIVLSVLLIDILSAGFRKIPFTCSLQPDSKQLLFRVLGSAVSVLVVVPAVANFEHWMLGRPIRFVVLGGLLLLARYLLCRYQEDLGAPNQALIFEDRPGSSFELLKLA
ncbi:MAG: hypothetical protein JO145_12135 [Acidobacteriaceae bacterium]|nr:hypothetical protein [Acidobacteriaceae bacterium]MBV9763844.1 hypothetical protein [Acidobacteriaceae bacterium]